MSITVTVENDTIKLPVHVPDGTRVEVTLPEEKRSEAREERVKGLFAAMDAVKEFGAAGSLSREEIHAH